MKNRWAVALVAAGVGVLAIASAAMQMSARAGRAGGSDERAAIVVELFTSEGCSSCPPADALLAQLVNTQPVGGAEVIGLGEHVDYWDRLGWRDRFSSAVLTNRQRTYSDVLKVESIYTPQMVVDGRAELVGSDARSARGAIERATTASRGHLELMLESVAPDVISARIAAADLPQPGKGDRDEAIVAVTEDDLKSDVRRGENSGRTLTHAAVVRSLTIAGEVAAGGGIASIGVPKIVLGQDWNRAHLKVVAFVQESRSRHIVAAAARPIPGAR
jgi:hypothetical protein